MAARLSVMACAVTWLLMCLSELCESQLNNPNTLYYQLQEEGGIGRPIASLISDAGLDIQHTADVLQQLHFQFLTEPKLNIHVDYDSGVLSNNGRIDREDIPGCAKNTHCQVVLDIAVQPIAHFQIYKVVIDVLDINDNPPVFDQQLYEHSLKESASLGSSFIVPSANDLDSPPNGVQTYELHSDMTLEPFALEVTEKPDGSLGLRIRLIQALDREHQDQYALTLMAYDGGDPTRSASIDILINVEDSNDNDPIFTNSSYTVTVPENVPILATILHVQAHDRDIGDNGRIQYMFSPQTETFHGDVFSIDPDTGAIFLVDTLDHEGLSLYNLIVTAQDLGPDSQSTDASIVINVEDVNDNAPTIVVNTLSSSGTNRAEIPEDSPIGTFVAHVTISDPDSGANGEYNCSLTDNAFRLVATEYDTEYQVFTTVRLDREVRPQYSLALACTDHGTYPQRAIQDIFIDVTDINDHYPVFAQPSYTSTIIENNYYGANVLQVHATDEDSGANAELNYAISVNVDDVFQIEPQTGLITAKTEIDREMFSQYRFTVVVNDKGAPPKSSTVSVVVTVEDVNDEHPYFMDELYTFSVSENEDPGTIVGMVSARDRDAPPYDEFIFSFMQGTTSSNAFMVDSRSGRILTQQVLDREKQSQYQLVVVVRDKASPRFSSTASVTIFVKDVNDNKPIFEFPAKGNNTIQISNLVPVGYNITHIQAHDNDIGPNGDVSYEIHGGDPDNLFDLDHNSGMLSTTTPLSSIPFKVCVLKILARDHGQPNPSVQLTDLTIVVNQSVPYIPPGSDAENMLSNQNLMIVISVACGCAVVAVILIVAIVCIHRQDRKQRTRQYNCRVEAMGRMTAKEHEIAMDRECCQDDFEKKPLENVVKTGLGSGGRVTLGGVDGAMTSQPQATPTSGQGPGPVTKTPLEVSATESVSSQGSDHSNADSGRGPSEEGDRKQRLNTTAGVPDYLPAPPDVFYHVQSEAPEPYSASLQYGPGYSSLKAHSAATQAYDSGGGYAGPQLSTFGTASSASTFGCQRRQAESSFTTLQPSHHSSPRGPPVPPHEADVASPLRVHGDRGLSPVVARQQHGDTSPWQGGGDRTASRNVVPCNNKSGVTGTSKAVLV